MKFFLQIIHFNSKNKTKIVQMRNNFMNSLRKNIFLRNKIELNKFDLHEYLVIFVVFFS